MSQNNPSILHVGLDVAKASLQLDLAGQSHSLTNDASGHTQLVKQGIHAPQSEAVAVPGEIRLEDRFQYVPQRALHDAVAHRRYAQQSLLFAAGLVDPGPTAGSSGHAFLRP